MEAALLEALRSLSPSNVLLVGVIVFLWRELQKEREARISSFAASLELGHTVRTTLDRQQEVIGRLSDLVAQLIARKD